MQKSYIKRKLITFKIFLILFMFSSSASAQTEFGIKGGLNFNYANNETYLIEGWKKCSICTLESQYFNIFDKKTGHFFGLYSKIKFGRFYVQPELLYAKINSEYDLCLLYTSPSPRDRTRSRMPSSA